VNDRLVILPSLADVRNQGLDSRLGPAAAPLPPPLKVLHEMCPAVDDVRVLLRLQLIRERQARSVPPATRVDQSASVCP